MKSRQGKVFKDAKKKKTKDTPTVEENVASVRQKKKKPREGRSHRSCDKKSTKAKGKRTYIHEDTKMVDLDETTGTGFETGGEASGHDSSIKTVDRVADWIRNCCKKGLRPLLKDFGEVRKYLPREFSTNIFHKNSSKNRYTDVLCIDETRVKLKSRSKDNDYIHASWVALPSGHKYICTQGPLEETIEDFWLMVYKEAVTAVIMLCDINENGEPKCAQYWPLNVGESTKFGDLKVKNIKHEKEKCFDTVKCHTLEIEINGEFHKLLHYQWVGWPDRAAPAKPTPVVDLMRKTKPLLEKGPIVVHCSAGIGRTGTYCAIDYAIERLSNGSISTMADIIKEIRRQRLHSVQSMLQYFFLHACIFEYLVITKTIPRDKYIKKFQKDYERYLRKFTERAAKDK